MSGSIFDVGMGCRGIVAVKIEVVVAGAFVDAQCVVRVREACCRMRLGDVDERTALCFCRPAL